MIRNFKFALIIILLFWLEASASAKEVLIEWKPIAEARAYELEVEGEGGTVLKKSLEEPKWTGELNPGAYTYRIRGIDLAKRPGMWTPSRILAIMPPPPKSKYPIEGNKLDLYNTNMGPSLKWEEVAGIKQYEIEVRKGGQLVSKAMAEGNQFVLKPLPTGKYSWTVASVLKPGPTAPAMLQGKQWSSPPNDAQEFNIEYKKLQSPQLIFPIGKQPPSENGKMKLQWSQVEGAQLYEVQLLRVKRADRKLRDLASELEKTKRYVTRETSLVAQTPVDGDYVWGVRAAADLDKNKNPTVAGPESVAQFNLDRNTVFKDDLGYFALSTMLSQYTYELSSPEHTQSGGSKADATVFRLSGEIWFKPQWAVGVSGDYARFVLNHQIFSRISTELAVKYRVKLSPGRFGWSLSPRLGGEYRTYNHIICSLDDLSGCVGSPDAPVAGTEISTLGFTGGFDIRRQFSEKLSLGIKVGYFFPMALVGGVKRGTSLGGGISYRNFNFGAQALYWLTPSLGLGAGGYFDMRSIGYTPPGNEKPEEITMDGAYFFGSIVYRIWK